MRRSTFLPALAAFTLILGCGNDLTAPLDSGAPGAAVAPGLNPNAASVTVPAGSVDALAAAIAAAGRNGTVILAAGTHTENGTVLVTNPVSIVGEAGAVLESGDAPSPTAPEAISGAFHVKGTSNVSISGLTIQGPGGATLGTGVLIENSSHVLVKDNVMTNVQFGVIIHRGDFARISGNSIAVTSDWLTGAVESAFGIVSMNGRGVILENNTASNALFGIWCCDAKGRATGNNVSGNFVGLILCTVPQGGFEIGGNLVGADRACTQWQVRDNVSTGNFTTGLLVIDNANRNHLVNNSGSGNGTYDIELTGDTYRFGFLTPASYENTVSMGQYPNVLIKNCGTNNMILGAGNLVDNNVDPCN